MKIKVRLLAGLHKLVPASSRDGELELKLADGATLRDLFHVCGLPEESITVAMINGIVSAVNTLLEDEDEIFLFPPVAGV